MKSLFALLRVHQYIKNLFVFAPLFFAAKVFETELLTNALFAFIAFSFCASAVYIFNDIRDVDEDREHEKKKLRPIAAGEFKVNTALTIAFVFIGLAFGTLLLASTKAILPLLIYVILNLAYSLKLKHVAIVDVSIIATGFVLRLFVGALATGIELSSWIVIMTFLLALFLALAKRRDDVLIYVITGKKMRKVIDGYNLQFLDLSMTLMAAVVVVSYLFYTTTGGAFGSDNNYLYLTSVFVILGILRYLQVTIVEEDSGSPTQIVLKDIFLQVVLLAWIASFFWIIYI
jgi:4-hydroxybenzoate polyprenyltransferase